jgi:hypothetical protein
MAEDAKPEQEQYLKLWFGQDGLLQLKGEGLSVYSILGILRAATLRFESQIAHNGSEPEPKKAGE